MISAFLLPSRGPPFTAVLAFLGFACLPAAVCLPLAPGRAFLAVSFAALAPLAGFPALLAFSAFAASPLAAARGWRAFQIRAAGFGASLVNLLLPGMLFQRSISRSAGQSSASLARSASELNRGRLASALAASSGVVQAVTLVSVSLGNMGVGGSFSCRAGLPALRVNTWSTPVGLRGKATLP